MEARGEMPRSFTTAIPDCRADPAGQKRQADRGRTRLEQAHRSHLPQPHLHPARGNRSYGTGDAGLQQLPEAMTSVRLSAQTVTPEIAACCGKIQTRYSRSPYR